MTSDSEPDPSTCRRRAIADSLRQYLSDATSMPPAPTPEPDDSIGWFAPAPADTRCTGENPGRACATSKSASPGMPSPSRSRGCPTTPDADVRRRAAHPGWDEAVLVVIPNA
ncbi:hypothetical protein GS506_17580 [Rhodococcus hoagii]|nr:hypothetical protein [Prescottella equi]